MFLKYQLLQHEYCRKTQVEYRFWCKKSLASVPCSILPDKLLLQEIPSISFLRRCNIGRAPEFNATKNNRMDTSSENTSKRYFRKKNFFNAATS